MSGFNRFAILLPAVLAVSATMVPAQNQYIGYVYPAGGRRNTTFQVRLGGQRLTHACGLVVSGEGVSVRLIDYYRNMNNQEMRLLRQQLKALQKKKKPAPLSDAMVAKMAWFEFPESVGPPKVEGVVCPACGRLNPRGTTV